MFRFLYFSSKKDLPKKQVVNTVPKTMLNAALTNGLLKGFSNIGSSVVVLAKHLEKLSSILAHSHNCQISHIYVYIPEPIQI